jgi:hypothetical protein
MAKGRIRSRMELREQYEAAEARERDERKSTGDEEEGDEEEAEGAADHDEAEEADEEAPKPKPKKKAPAKESKPRKKPAKLVRRRVVWVVYDNSNKKIAQYDYTKRSDADEHAARLSTEKKQTYFVQPFKEEITE